MRVYLALSLPVLLATAPLGAEQDADIVVATPAGTQHEMVLVPAGEAMIGHGSGASGALPSQTVYLPAFYIDKYEVTNGLYREFLRATGTPPPDLWSWDYREGIQPDSANHPAVGVTWANAVGYCRWAGLRLPTNTEWEKAARGDDGRTYPWGEVFDSTRANVGRSDGDVCCSPDASDGYEYLAPVGSYPAGASPYGALDMAGNASEWAACLLSADPSPDSGCLRGGSWREPADLAISYLTGEVAPGMFDAIQVMVGFRCAQNYTQQTRVRAQGWGATKHQTP